MSLPDTSVLNRTVSMVGSFTCTATKDINLWRFLTNRHYRPQIDQIRTASDKTERDKLKARLPAVMISGRFNGKRSEQNLVEHSGLISFDLDHVVDIEAARLKIQQLPFVAYLSLSASGKGLFGIVPVLYADKHKEHFEALCLYFKEHDLPELDTSPSSVASLRAYSYDDNAYVNHHAEPFILMYSKPKPKQKPLSSHTGNAGFAEFNRNFDVEALLEKHNWTFCREYGNRHYYTRPGKDTGVSATFFTDTRKFYVFTSSTGLTPRSTHDAFSLYRELECNGNADYAKQQLLN